MVTVKASEPASITVAIMGLWYVTSFSASYLSPALERNATYFAGRQAVQLTGCWWNLLGAAHSIGDFIERAETLIRRTEKLNGESNIGDFTMMRFSEVEAFRAVMLSGSTTAAAQTLHTSQPNVSRAIALLEQKTGLKLFDRLPGRLVPTSDARSFFKEVQRSFAGLHHLDEAAKRIKRFSGGALTVAAVQMLALGLVPRIMQQFCHNLPEVSVSIHTGHATTVARWVEDQTCDVGLVSQVNNNYGLAYEHLYELDAVCVMPADHRLARKEVITPQDLANEPFISLPRNEHGYSLVDTHFEKAGIDRHIRLETSYSSITCSLVMQGLGLSIVNPLASLDYRHSGMVTRPFLPTVKHQGYIIYPKERMNDRLISDFVATVKDVLACELERLGCKAPA